MAPDQLPQACEQAGHARADGYSRDVGLEVDVDRVEQRPDDDAEFIGGADRVGGKPPVVDQPVSRTGTVHRGRIVDADDGLRVADIDSKQHRGRIRRIDRGRGRDHGTRIRTTRDHGLAVAAGPATAAATRDRGRGIYYRSSHTRPWTGDLLPQQPHATGP